MDTVTTLRTSRLARIFSALADSNRLQLVNLLKRQKNICVSELAAHLGISVSAVSQAMKNLELSGLVTRKRQGQRICYQLNSEEPFVDEVIKFIERSEHV